MTTKIQTFGGNIGIGTTDPGDFNLNVNGSLKTNSLVVNGVTDAHLPIGILGMWSGSLGSIPSGWKLCDGSTYTRTDGGGNITTPDLRNKFIRGATGDAPSPVAKGTTGGQNTMTLGVANLASHSHGVSVSQGNANHNHNTAASNMAHAHPVGTTQTPHDHGETSATNNKHNHGTSGDGSANHLHECNYSNMPHSHNTSTDNVNHAHDIPINIRTTFGRGGPRGNSTCVSDGSTGDTSSGAIGTIYHGHVQISDWTSSQHSHGVNTVDAPHSHNTGGDNWGHTHNMPEVNANHSHNTGAGNVPHSHTVNAANAPHGHNANSNNTGQGTAFSVLNAYYALFYIMKI
jgi:hypothetical protein